MLTLRPYQAALVERARQAYVAGKRAPLIVAPCGAGKTVIFTYMAVRAAEKGKRILLVAHREELLDQISETFEAFGVPHGWITPHEPFNPAMTVQVGGVFTVARRLNRMHGWTPDLIVIDEASHAIAGSTWGKVTAGFPDALRLGVTATPERLSGEPLSDTFDELIVGPGVRELIAAGALCDYRIFVPSTIDVGGVHTRMGDFVKGELTQAADKPGITGDAIKEYKKYADHKRAVAFCVSIEHARHVAESFRAAGYRSVSLYGTLDRNIRREVVRDFRDGKIEVLTSCDLISEGFDLPAIEVAILLRPTQSLALSIQQTGRALRPWPGKQCAYILDHAGNVMRHGLPDDEREWSLEGRAKRQDGEGGTVGIRICPVCFAAQTIGRNVCIHCGGAFPAKPRVVEENEGELVEVDTEALRATAKMEQGRARTFMEIVELGKRRGYRNPYSWALHVIRGRHAARQREQLRKLGQG